MNSWSTTEKTIDTNPPGVYGPGQGVYAVPTSPPPQVTALTELQAIETLTDMLHSASDGVTDTLQPALSMVQPGSAPSNSPQPCGSSKLAQRLRALRDKIDAAHG